MFIIESMMTSLKWQGNSKNAPISEMSTKLQEMRKCRRNGYDCLKMPRRELVVTKASCSLLSWQNVDISCLKMRPLYSPGRSGGTA